MPKQLAFLRGELPDYRVLVVNYINGIGEADASSEIYDISDEEIPNPYEIALFYRRDRFEVVDGGHWWMSPTPERPSTGFGNRWPRTVLWSRFRCESGDILVFATHIDHRCVGAMISLCRERFDALATSGTPLILAGDLNFNPTHPAYRSLLSDGWRDSGESAPPESPTFLLDLPGVPSGRIDHIFSTGQVLNAAEWARLLPAPGEPPVSDHHPVFARFDLA
jgi:endonuclease/exonuclease/phosphatase family metal-dependent hydrolase